MQNVGRRERRNVLTSACNIRGGALRDQCRLANAITDYKSAIAPREELVEKEGSSELVAYLESALFNRTVSHD